MFGFFKKLFGSTPQKTQNENTVLYKVETPMATPAPVPAPAPAPVENKVTEKPAKKTKTKKDSSDTIAKKPKKPRMTVVK